ncbi:ATP-binding cassette domain-containing protein [Streptomyces anulatus]
MGGPGERRRGRCRRSRPGGRRRAGLGTPARQRVPYAARRPATHQGSAGSSSGGGDDGGSRHRGGRRDGRTGDTTLLAPTTFSVLPGQFWCVTGGNGSGKTTLLRAFLGSRALTAGSCSVLGDPVDLAKPLHRRLASSRRSSTRSCTPGT